MKALESIVAYSLEGFFMAGAGLSLLGLRLEIRKLIYIAIIYGCFVYSVRHIYALLEIPLGSHVFILMIIFTLLIIIIGKVNLITASLASLTSVLLIFWGEGVFLYPALIVLKIDIISLMNANPGYTILAILISDTLLIIAFFIGYIFNISLLDFAKERLEITTKE